MTTLEKVIKNKLGLLELSQQLGKYHAPARLWATVVTVFIVLRSCTNKEVRLPCRKFPAVDRL